MNLYRAFSGLFFVFLHEHEITGYTNCHANTTFFVPGGRTAYFNVQANVHAHEVRFLKSDSYAKTIFDAFLSRDRLDKLYTDNLISIRINTTVNTDGHMLHNLTISLSNVSLADNGTYYILLEGMNFFCWILFVMDIHSTPLLDNRAARIFASPASSVVIRPLTNVTMMWLIDGEKVDESVDFLALDGILWIPKVGRYLNGKTVTYRALQDDGNVTDANLTLAVKYGPDFPLIISPEKTYYELKSGDSMPDVSCHAECNPPCSISWGSHSSSNVLRLGQVTEDTSGEYTCTAWSSLNTVSRSVYVHVQEINCTALCFPPCNTTWNRGNDNMILQIGIVTADMAGEYICRVTRNGLEVCGEKTITLFVKDERTTSAALIAVGTCQALTTLVLSIIGICYCAKARGIRCRNWLLPEVKSEEKAEEAPPRTSANVIQYEQLDMSRRNVSTIHPLYDDAEQGKRQYEIYENTM